jgi:hypothetical protein
LRRLCLLIFVLRRFFRDPMLVLLFCVCVKNSAFCAKEREVYLINNFVQWIFYNSFGAGILKDGDDLPHDVFIDNGFHGHPAIQA